MVTCSRATICLRAIFLACGHKSVIERSNRSRTISLCSRMLLCLRTKKKKIEKKKEKCEKHESEEREKHLVEETGRSNAPL